MIGKNSERIQIIIPKKEADVIRALAEKENRSISNYVYSLIKKELQKLKK